MSCRDCPIKQKCDRRFDLSLAGVTDWYCETNALIGFPGHPEMTTEMYNKIGGQGGEKSLLLD